MRTQLALAIAALVVAVPACGRDRSSLPPCAAPPPAIGPDAAGSLEVADTGKTVCLTTGNQLNVFLAPAQDGTRWDLIKSSDQATLEPVGAGALTLVRGVTGGVFRGKRAGVATLSSRRGNERWRVQVVVRR